MSNSFLFFPQYIYIFPKVLSIKFQWGSSTDISVHKIWTLTMWLPNHCKQMRRVNRSSRPQTRIAEKYLC